MADLASVKVVLLDIGKEQRRKTTDDTVAHCTGRSKERLHPCKPNLETLWPCTSSPV